MFSNECLYDFKEKIGNGSFGEVWLVKNFKSGKKCVLKKLKLSSCSPVEKRRAVLESQLLATLRHPNIVTYYDSFFQSSKPNEEGMLNIVMCFCEGGDLYQRIQKQKGKLIEESQIVEWLIQICMALKYLTDKRILHRDLKTRNIFLTRKGLVKLGDFGIARVLDGTSDMAATLIGTPYYMSPEILMGKPYNHKSDIWSLGCCVYEMASLKHAFQARNFNSLLYKVLHCPPPEIPSCFSEDLSSLTSALLNSDPDKRPSAQSLLDHPFIHKHIYRFLEITKHRSPSDCSQIDKNLPTKQPGTIKEMDVAQKGTSNDKDCALKPESEVDSAIITTKESPPQSIVINEAYTQQNAHGKTFSVDSVCKNSVQDVDATECHLSPLQVPSSKGETVLKQYKEMPVQTKNNDASDNKSDSKTCKPSNFSEFQVICTDGKEKPEVTKHPPSEARARRRNLQKCSCSVDSLHNSSIKGEGHKNSAEHNFQRPNMSARQRRRERLKQVTVDSSQEETSKSRPKSAPSRLLKQI